MCVERAALLLLQAGSLSGCTCLHGDSVWSFLPAMQQCNIWACMSVAGRRLQERPYRYLDRASVEGAFGALTGVTELRLAAPAREDSESSSATCGDSPTSTIQLIVKRDS